MMKFLGAYQVPLGIAGMGIGPYRIQGISWEKMPNSSQIKTCLHLAALDRVVPLTWHSEQALRKEYGDNLEDWLDEMVWLRRVNTKPRAYISIEPLGRAII